MSWLRLDDGITEHPKILALKRSDRWTWIELLAYCARQKNGGHVPEGISDVLRWVTPAFVEQCVSVGLVDRDERGLHIHDWASYNAPTLSERVTATLAQHPEMSANQVALKVGGSRKLALAEVARQRGNPAPIQESGGSPPGTELVPNRFPGGTSAGTDGGTESVLPPVTRARSPAPSTPNTPRSSKALASSAALQVAREDESPRRGKRAEQRDSSSEVKTIGGDVAAQLASLRALSGSQGDQGAQEAPEASVDAGSDENAGHEEEPW